MPAFSAMQPGRARQLPRSSHSMDAEVLSAVTDHRFQGTDHMEGTRGRNGCAHQIHLEHCCKPCGQPKGAAHAGSCWGSRRQAAAGAAHAGSQRVRMRRACVERVMARVQPPPRVCTTSTTQGAERAERSKSKPTACGRTRNRGWGMCVRRAAAPHCIALCNAGRLDWVWGEREAVADVAGPPTHTLDAHAGLRPRLRTGTWCSRRFLGPCLGNGWGHGGAGGSGPVALGVGNDFFAARFAPAQLAHFISSAVVFPLLVSPFCAPSPHGTLFKHRHTCGTPARSRAAHSTAHRTLQSPWHIDYMTAQWPPQQTVHTTAHRSPHPRKAAHTVHTYPPVLRWCTALDGCPPPSLYTSAKCPSFWGKHGGALLPPPSPTRALVGGAADQPRHVPVLPPRCPAAHRHGAPPPPRRPKGPLWEKTKFTIGKSDRAIFGTQTFGSQTPPPPPPLSILPCGRPFGLTARSAPTAFVRPQRPTDRLAIASPCLPTTSNRFGTHFGQPPRPPPPPKRTLCPPPPPTLSPGRPRPPKRASPDRIRLRPAARSSGSPTGRPAAASTPRAARTLVPRGRAARAPSTS